MAVSHMCMWSQTTTLLGQFFPPTMSSKDQTQVVRLMQPAVLLATLSAGQRTLDLRVVQQLPFFKKDNFLSYCFAFIFFFFERGRREHEIGSVEVGMIWGSWRRRNNKQDI